MDWSGWGVVAIRHSWTRPFDSHIHRVANGNKPQAVLVGGVGGGCGCVGDIVMAVPTTKEEEEGEDPRNPPVV